MKQKSVKSLVKRFKATKNGKILKRKSGQDHLNAKEPGKITRAKRNDWVIAKNSTKNILRLIN